MKAATRVRELVLILGVASYPTFVASNKQVRIDGWMVIKLKLQYSLMSIFVTTLLVGPVIFVYSFIYRPDPPIPVYPSTRNDLPIVSIFRYSGMVRESDYHDPFVEFAIWGDGTVVWRKDANDPRSPLLSKRVKKGLIDQLFKELSSARLLEPDLRTSHVGSDSGHVAMEIATDQRIVKLASWHERFSQLPLVICTENGLEGIKPGQNKQDFLEKCSREYKLFRRNWAVIREFSNELRDSAGEPFEGVIPMPGQ